MSYQRIGNVLKAQNNTALASVSSKVVRRDQGQSDGLVAAGPDAARHRPGLQSEVAQLSALTSRRPDLGANRAALPLVVRC